MLSFQLKHQGTTWYIAANVAGRNSIKRTNNTISDYLYSSALHAHAPDSNASTFCKINSLVNMRCFLSFLFCMFSSFSYCCTILSGTDNNGHTWACNNEDWNGFSFYNYVNVFPKEEMSRFGYVTLTYGAANAYIQGGVNEAGLFFDFNALPPAQTSKNALKEGRTLYPGGLQAMLVYMLANCKSVAEVVQLWKKYYCPLQSQIHLADSSGQLCLITPDSIIFASKNFNVSTNFNLCDPDPVKYKCWRYPIAEKILREEGVSRTSIFKAAKATFRRSTQSTTLYTNLHDLSSGDMWFYFGEDSTRTWHTNIHTLVQKGKHSILLMSLFPQHNAVKLYRMMENGANESSITRFLEKGKFTDLERESILRMCYTAYLVMENKVRKAEIIFPLWMKYAANNTRNDPKYTDLIEARHFAYLGDYRKAISMLDSLNENVRGVTQLKNSLALNEKEGTTQLTLQGHPNARSVYVFTADDYQVYFMKRKNGNWVATIPKNREINYVFYVDDTRILDPNRSDKKIAEAMSGKLEEFSSLKISN